jgi:hypothetical protein
MFRNIAYAPFCKAKPDLRHLHHDGPRLRALGSARHLEAFMREASILL